MTKISVIIPVYNAGKYLSDALESVKKQSFTEWECICIDDGSTDGSADIINTFTVHDERFKLINQENSGVSAARNAGLDSATGKYIAFLDQDDLMSPTALESLYTLAEKYNVDLVRGRRLNIPEDYKQNKLEAIKLNNDHKLIQKINVLNFRMLPRRWMYVWLCLFKRDFLDDIRFYEPLKSGAEDNVFMFEVFIRVQSLIQSQNVICLHRKSKISTMQNGLKINHLDAIKLAVPKFYELTQVSNNPLSRHLYKRQMRNFFRGFVYKSLDSNVLVKEAQAMLQITYSYIQPSLKLKHRIVAYFFVRNRLKIANFIRKLPIV